MSVLLITRSDDNASVSLVADALRRRGESSFRLDTDRFPEDVRLATRLSRTEASADVMVERRFVGPAGQLSGHDVTAVWYRRFFAGGRLPMELGDLRVPSVEESRRSLAGAIGALPCFQLDRLESVRRCDHKELQLVRGSANGLDVPRTLFTNDPDAARAFFAECGGRVVTKMQSSFAVHRDGREHVVFTSVVEPRHLDEFEGLRLCPMTFQEQIPKAVELRVVVVGKHVFAASVDSQQRDETKVDWRKDGVGLLRKWRPHALPDRVSRSLLALLDELGLQFGAADFIVTPEGRTVFLEVNAGGEWLWLDESQPGSAGLPIAAAIAEVLTIPEARRALKGQVGPGPPTTSW